MNIGIIVALSICFPIFSLVLSIDLLFTVFCSAQSFLISIFLCLRNCNDGGEGSDNDKNDD